MYGDIIRKLIFNNLEDYKVGCNRSLLTEESITYAEIIFPDLDNLLGVDNDMIIHRIKCGSCYCEPKKKVIV